MSWRAWAALLVAAPVLGGCFEATRGSIAGGECKVMQRPPYVVQGKAAYDQNWIDNEIEGGIAACGWKRPARRPAELDARPAAKAKAKPARKRLLQRVKEVVLPAPPPAPVVESPAAPSAPPAPPPRPSTPLERLLGGKR